MKKASIILSMLCLAFSWGAMAENDGKNIDINTNNTPVYSQMNDWRIGDYRRKVTENFISFDVEAMPVIATEFKETTPWAAGLRIGFEHKTRPSSISSRFSIGYGGHIGVNRYFGQEIEVSAIGNPNAIARDKFKSYTEIPAMLDFNWYYNFHRSNISLGLSAGVNILLGERDATVSEFDSIYVPSIMADALESLGYIASVQQNANNVVVSHIIPTARVLLGYMFEMSQDWRLRIQAGMEYQMKYADEYKGMYLDTDYLEFYHKGDSPAALNPFVSVGLIYSI